MTYRTFVQYQSLIGKSVFFFFWSELLTNDKALAKIADHGKKMPIESLHFSLIILKFREMTSNIFLLQNTNDKFALTYTFYWESVFFPNLFSFIHHVFL